MDVRAGLILSNLRVAQRELHKLANFGELTSAPADVVVPNFVEPFVVLSLPSTQSGDSIVWLVVTLARIAHVFACSP